ncbi:hypothetical protein [Moraxella cuniculi]|nr:hypothetical protein [Moraxella cuniculi]
MPHFIAFAYLQIIVVIQMAGFLAKLPKYTQVAKGARLIDSCAIIGDDC